MMVTKTNEMVKVETGYEAFGTIQLEVSTVVNASNEEEASNKAILNLHELAIAQGYLTVMLNDGTVASLKVHNWELLNGIEAVYEDEE